MMHRRRWRGWFVLEILVGFLPLIPVLLMGALMTPVWIASLGKMAFDADIRARLLWQEVAVVCGSLLMVAIGVLGVVALLRVAHSILDPDVPLAHPFRTRMYAIIATCLVVMAVIFVAAIGYPVIAMLGVPSLLVSGHVMYLARHVLFRGAPQKAD